MTAHIEHHPARVVARGHALAVDVACVILACDHDGCSATYATVGGEGAPLRAPREPAAHGWTHDGGERDGCAAHPVG
jgi:hypothetical protein